MSIEQNKNNPYQTPEANLIEEKDENLTIPYYVVGKKKAWALFIATVGMYQIYWFYKHWAENKSHEGSSIWPVPRAVFSIFFCHSLFKKIKESHESSGLVSNWVASTSASIYVGFSIVSNISDRVSDKVDPMIGASVMVIGIIAMFISIHAMIQAQVHVNEIAESKNTDLNQNFTWANYIWLFLGVIFWAFLILGVLIIFNPALINF